MNKALAEGELRAIQEKGKPCLSICDLIMGAMLGLGLSSIAHAARRIKNTPMFRNNPTGQADVDATKRKMLGRK